MGRYLTFFGAALLLLLGAAWFWAAVGPMSFLDPEYPMWKAKGDMARELQPESVVILGDSRALAGFIPGRIGPDVVNLALGGGTPIEAYHFSRRLLASGRPPRAVILSFSPVHFLYAEAFWERAVKFGFYDWEEIEAIRKQSRRYDTPILWGMRDLTFADSSLLFGPVTLGDVEARLKAALYAARFPSFYYSALVERHLFRWREPNLEMYRAVRATRGQHGFGSRETCDMLGIDAGMKAFAPAPLLDFYFAETLALLQSRGIPVFFVATPLNTATASALRPGIAEGYASHVAGFEARFPGFRRLGDPFPVFDGSFFGDPDHTNARGAGFLSDRVAAWLREAGVEK